MENEFTQVMSERTDEELIKIVTVERENYQLLAVEAAEQEVEKRNIDPDTFEKVKEQVTAVHVQKTITDSGTVGSDIRFVHYIVDVIASYILVIVVFILLGIFFPFEDEALLGFFSIIMFFGSFFGYYFVMELQFQKTLGKFITKTKVVNKYGEKPTVGELVARTFCRFIPFDNFSFLFTKNGFHDSLSSTKVVRDSVNHTKK
ncbi:RDD family protein [Flagellimonas sp.]|uniref:RDD family protein n=1 Tax=Flagellimonas sp. TaxID=2058762 RepID=UPI003BAEB64E